MCEYRSLLVLCQNLMYYGTALSAVFDWICVLQVSLFLELSLSLLSLLSNQLSSEICVCCFKFLFFYIHIYIICVETNFVDFDVFCSFSPRQEPAITDAMVIA